VGGFWAAVICYLNEKHTWPTIKDIFYADEAEARIEVIPLQKEAADRLWKTSYHKHTETDIGHIRILRGSSWEDAIHFLRRRASTQTSTETSGVKRQISHQDESDEEVEGQEETEADTEVEEKRREVQQPIPISIPRPTFKPRQPQGPQRHEEWKVEQLRHLSGSQHQSQSQTQGQQIQQRRRERRKVEIEAEAGTAEEEEPEPGTDYEEIRRGEEEEHEGERIFDWDKRIDPKVVTRMNQLGDLLKMKRIGRAAHLGSDIEEEGEANNFREELEALLRSFEEDEILPQEESETVSLDDPILRLFTQSRCFRIC
jgi:hypothetical protein